MLKHIFLISSAGLLCGWAMVEAGLATRPILAGCVVAAVLVSLYGVLSILVWLLRPLLSRYAQGDGPYYADDSLAGFDSRGDLRIESEYPNRR